MTGRVTMAHPTNKSDHVPSSAVATPGKKKIHFLLHLQQQVGNAVTTLAVQRSGRNPQQAPQVEDAILANSWGELMRRAGGLAGEYIGVRHRGAQIGEIRVWRVLTLNQPGDIDVHFRPRGQGGQLAENQHVKVTLQALLRQQRILIRMNVLTWDRQGPLPVASARYVLNGGNLREVRLQPGSGGPEDISNDESIIL